MFNVLISIFILAGFVLCICVIGFIYCKKEKKREESRMKEKSNGENQNSDAAVTKLAMHSRYNGLNNRGRIN